MKTEVAMKTENFEEHVPPSLSDRLRSIVNRMEARMEAPKACLRNLSNLRSDVSFKDFVVGEFLNTATEEELKGLKGINEETAVSIIQLCDESSLEQLEDLKKIGLSDEQVKLLILNLVEKKLDL